MQMAQLACRPCPRKALHKLKELIIHLPIRTND